MNPTELKTMLEARIAKVDADLEKIRLMEMQESKVIMDKYLPTANRLIEAKNDLRNELNKLITK